MEKTKELNLPIVGGPEVDYDRKSGLSAETMPEIYESLCTLCTQEAAYAQFQLGCQQRDSSLVSMEKIVCKLKSPICILNSLPDMLAEFYVLTPSGT